MNNESIFTYLMNIYKHIFYGKVGSTLYLNKFSDACKFYAYINSEKLENALYHIIESEKDKEQFDAAIIICTQEMLFHKINIEKTINYVKRIIGSSKNSNLSKTCSFNLNSYYKGHTYQNIFRNDYLFCLKNIDGCYSFNKIVKANATSFNAIPPVIKCIYSETHFCEIVEKEGIQRYLNNTTKNERNIFLSHSSLPRLSKELIKEFFEKKDDDLKCACEKIRIYNVINVEKYREELDEKVSNLLNYMESSK